MKQMVDEMESRPKEKLNKWKVDSIENWQKGSWQKDSRWNGKLMKWKVDEMKSWWNEKLMKWKVD